MIGINDGTDNNQLGLMYRGNDDDRLTVYMQVNGTTFEFNKYSFVIEDYHKLALRWNNTTNTIQVFDGGTEIITGSYTGNLTGLDVLAMHRGSSSSTWNFYGKVKAIKVYKEALSDTDLQNLTS
jgi:hypothetical protein